MENSKKQTAVEYIEKAYSDACYNMMIYKIQIHKDFLPNLIKQAKELEKQHIISAFIKGFNRDYFSSNFQDQKEFAEQYYNETFKK